MFKTFIHFTLFFSFISPTWADQPKPKYGPEATPLSVSHEYFQKHAAPLFWSMIPYYLPQQTGSSCSVAATTMVVNTARAGMNLLASEKLATESDVLARVKNPAWKKGAGLLGHGVSLDEIGPLIEESLKAYGVKPAKVEVVHAENLTAQTKERLHEALLENEKSGRSFIVANFIQGEYTGDADVGHFAPVAAYDSEKKRVLVLDPDREWYEPYWVSEETFLKGMATKDKGAGHNRGYVQIKLPARQ